VIEIFALWLKADYVLNIAVAADGTDNAMPNNTKNDVKISGGDADREAVPHTERNKKRENDVNFGLRMSARSSR
jgi:hypothetical protein